jgi:hypothetical protein
VTEPPAGPPGRPGRGDRGSQPGDPQRRGDYGAAWREARGFGPDERVLTPPQLARLRELDAGPGPDPADFDPACGDPAYADPGLDDLSPEDLTEMHCPPDPAAGRAGRREPIPAGFTHAGQNAPGEGPGLGFGCGGVADAMLPGAMLAALTGRAFQDGLDRLSDDELVGIGLAARRNESWQAAIRLAVVSELSARRQRDARETGDSRAAEHFGKEIAVAFTLTNRAADAEFDCAAGLERLPEVAALLAAGMLDQARAKIICDETACVDPDLARAAAARVLPGAGGLTTGQLRQAVRRAVLAADPAAAIRRRKAAERDARVEAWAEQSGTAALAGRDLSPAGVALADRNIDATARWLKAHGAEGTLANLRAGVFLALLSGRSPLTLLPAGTASPAATGSTGAPATAGPGFPSLIHLTLPLTSWAGRTDSPGQITGLGPFDAGACRDLGTALAAHPGTRYCLTLTDRHGRAVGHACSRAGPGPPGTDPAAWLARLKITWLSTGTCAHQLQTPGYRPGTVLRHLVTIRHPACTRPGCRRQSARCDLDHCVPYDQGGRTCECDLHPACRGDHQAKQAPGWHVEQPEPGILVWTLPHGRRYTTRPEPYPD